MSTISGAYTATQAFDVMKYNSEEKDHIFSLGTAGFELDDTK
jgi:hypothetical protein